MNQDGCYNSLEVRKLLKVNNLSAKKIFLEDVSLESNPSMLGSRIKKLYEEQKNTNVFSDEDKKFVQDLKKLVSVSSDHLQFHKVQYTNLVHVDTLNDDDMPNDTSCLCITSENEVVYKIKHNGKVSFANVHHSDHTIDSELSVNNDDSISVNLNVN